MSGARLVEDGVRPRIAIVDYGIGNLPSAQKATERAGGDAFISRDPAEIARADGVILPGVGAMARCMASLSDCGVYSVVVDAIASGRPFLGICVGMQMLHRGSEEHGGVEGLGVFDGVVRLLPDTVKRPQMQWNIVTALRPSMLLAELPNPAWMYFVHSFAPEMHADVVGVCDYGGPVAAVIERGAITGTQFHPEKSSATGIALLGNFVRACMPLRPGSKAGAVATQIGS